MLIIELERAKVNVALLSEAQRMAHLLPHAMTGYVSWLAPQLSALHDALRARLEETRRRTIEKDKHLRVPEALANLELGLHYGLAYAEHVGACSPAEAEAQYYQAWEALVSLGRAQGRLVQAERPTLRFLHVLYALITQGKAYLSPKNTAEDDDRRGNLLGWQDSEYLYLIPEASFQAVVKFCREADEPFVIREGRLRQDLARENLIEPNEERRHTAVVRIGSRVERVLRLKRRACENIIGAEFPWPAQVKGRTDM
jgi:hypothetical protein